MARKKRLLSPATALHLIEILIKEGKLLAHDVVRYLRIAELEKRLRALRGGEGRGPKTARPRKTPVSAERRASQKVQGQYLGYLRQIAKSGRARFQNIAKKEGREKAIAAMKKQLGK
jgi:hypothetical protein